MLLANLFEYEIPELHEPIALADFYHGVVGGAQVAELLHWLVFFLSSPCIYGGGKKLGIITTWHIEELAVALFLKEENGDGVGIILIDCLAPIRHPLLTLDRHLIEDCELAAGD